MFRAYPPRFLAFAGLLGLTRTLLTLPLKKTGHLVYPVSKASLSPLDISLSWSLVCPTLEKTASTRGYLGPLL